MPAADPSTWWGTRSATRSVQPIRDPERPVPVSASMLESILLCPAQWFFEREAGGVSAVHQSANLGQVLHALAERVAPGELPAEVEPLMAEVEAIWDRLAFRTPWSRQRELARIRKAVGRFVRWHLDNPRESSPPRSGSRASSRSRAARCCSPGSPTGSRSTTTAAWWWSTSRAPAPHRPAPPSPATSSSPSTSTPSTPAPSTRRPVGPWLTGGAELVQLGVDDDSAIAKVQGQPAHGDTGPERACSREGLARAADLVRAENFPATAGPHCRDCPFVAICPAKGAGSVTVQ